MKVIGLLGGMSWESSIVYERIINEEVRRRLGGVHSADLIIRCTEIELLVHDDHLSLPYFPTTRLLALAAVDRALADA